MIIDYKMNKSHLYSPLENWFYAAISFYFHITVEKGFIEIRSDSLYWGPQGRNKKNRRKWCTIFPHLYIKRRGMTSKLVAYQKYKIWFSATIFLSKSSFMCLCLIHISVLFSSHFTPIPWKCCLQLARGTTWYQLGM